MNYTIQNVREALQYNAENNLYAGDLHHYRVYATFDGGRYNGQITSIKSVAMLEKYLAEHQAFKDINIITDREGLAELMPSRA